MNALEQAKALFYQALEHHRRDQLRDAEALYRKALTLAPERISILANLGAVMLREGRWKEAREIAERAMQIQKDCSEGLALLAEIERARRGPAAALPAVDLALVACADDPDLLLQRSALRGELGQLTEARSDAQRALQLRPGHPPTRLHLAVLSADLGKPDQAIVELEVLLQEDARFLPAGETWAKLQLNAIEHTHAQSRPADAALWARALDTPWAPLRQLLPQACRALAGDRKVEAWLGRARSVWPQRLPDYSLADLRLAPALFDQPLLRALLRQPSVPEPTLQHLLINLRGLLLSRASETASQAWPPAMLAFHCALAAHCARTQHVYPTLESENTRVLQLRHRLLQSLDSGESIPPPWVPALAAFLPLAGVRGAARMKARAWPTPVQALLRLALADSAPLPSLRWTRGSVSPRAVALADYLLECRVPLGGFSPPAVPDPRVLALNVGAGEWAIEIAQRVQGAKVLALDPDPACAEACAERARQLQLPRLSSRVGDLAEAGVGGYTLIDSGRRLLVPRPLQSELVALKRWLAPRGLLRLRLASSRLRDALRAARRELGNVSLLGSTTELREARERLMALPPEHPAHGLVGLPELHSMGPCRSLLCEYDDRPLDLLELNVRINSAGLRFRGIEFGQAERAGLLPRRALPPDLPAWTEFEASQPQAFSHFYTVWVSLS